MSDQSYYESDPERLSIAILIVKNNYSYAE